MQKAPRIKATIRVDRLPTMPPPSSALTGIINRGSLLGGVKRFNPGVAQGATVGMVGVDIDWADLTRTTFWSRVLDRGLDWIDRVKALGAWVRRWRWTPSGPFHMGRFDNIGHPFTGETRAVVRDFGTHKVRWLHLFGPRFRTMTPSSAGATYTLAVVTPAQITASILEEAARRYRLCEVHDHRYNDFYELQVARRWFSANTAVRLDPPPPDPATEAIYRGVPEAMRALVMSGGRDPEPLRTALVSAVIADALTLDDVDGLIQHITVGQDAVMPLCLRRLWEMRAGPKLVFRETFSAQDILVDLDRVMDMMVRVQSGI